MLIKYLATVILSYLVIVGPAAAETTLRIVPGADLSSLDPIATSAAITKTHGYLVYDVLFAQDAKGVPQPEMIESYTVAEQGLRYDFTLRGGQTWHDGTPVTARDAVASLKRWAARAAGGQILLDRLDRIEVVDTLTFTIHLHEPYADLLLLLADPFTPSFVMRERDALTDPFQSVREVVGSGPFMFVADDYRPGSRVVYRRNPRYRPRAEPPSGLAGGKIAKVDRIEWLIMSDSSVAAAALSAGDVDLVESPPFELLASLSHTPDVVVRPKNDMGYLAILRPNQAIAPFDNPKARQALAALVDQQDYLDVLVGLPAYERPCADPFGCDRPTEAKSASHGHVDIARAKQLFAEAGYRGEPIVVMDPVDLDIVHNMTLLTIQNLREAGVTVDHQTMDWATLLKRRAVKESPATNPAGWNIFQITVPVANLQDPATHAYLAATCDGKNWFGWPCDKQLDAHRLAYLNAATPGQRDQAVEQLRQRFAKALPFVPLGQYFRAIAYNKAVSGLVDAPYLVFWGIQKQ